MAEHVLVVPGTPTVGPDVQTLELVPERAPEVDRIGAPGRDREVIRKEPSHLGAHLETARPDPGTYRCSVWWGTETGHLLAKSTHHARCRSAPSGVGHPYHRLRDQDHTETVGGEDSERQPGHVGEDGIGLAHGFRPCGPYHLSAVHLTDCGPCRADPQLAAHADAGLSVAAQVTLRGVGEGGTAPIGARDHPWTKLGISRSSSERNGGLPSVPAPRPKGRLGRRRPSKPAAITVTFISSPRSSSMIAPKMMSASASAWSATTLAASV